MGTIIDFPVPTDAGAAVSDEALGWFAGYALARYEMARRLGRMTQATQATQSWGHALQLIAEMGMSPPAQLRNQFLEAINEVA